jgi:hypothetical protein
MPLNHCPCGAIPTLTTKYVARHRIVQIKCKCGKVGGEIAYRRPSDKERTEAAAVEAWNACGNDQVA